MPSKDEIYRIWAPPDALWSRWVKPILFSFADGVFEAGPIHSVHFEADWVPVTGPAAIVLDLPRDDGVRWSVKLAGMGYRPVPLYNALPFPVSEKMTAPTSRPISAVQVEPILLRWFVRRVSSSKSIWLRMHRRYFFWMPIVVLRALI